MSYLIVYAKESSQNKAFVTINLRVCEFIELGFNPVGELKVLLAGKDVVYYQYMYLRRNVRR